MDTEDKDQGGIITNIYEHTQPAVVSISHRRSEECTRDRVGGPVLCHNNMCSFVGFYLGLKNADI